MNVPKATSIRLVVTDLDGTLLWTEDGAEDLAAFRELLEQARRAWRTKWVIATGRNVQTTHPVLCQFRGLGLQPDYLILEDGQIYRRTERDAMAPFWWWNCRINRRRKRLVKRWRSQVRAWHDELLALYPAATDFSRNGMHVWFRFEDPDNAAQAETFLRNNTRSFDEFYVFRWDLELGLVPTAGTKGEALRKLARSLNIHPSTVFAVGDGPNDVSMLDGCPAGLVACVANAAPEVKQAVTGAGGHIGKHDGPKGVVEALRAFIGDATDAA